MNFFYQPHPKNDAGNEKGLTSGLSIKATHSIILLQGANIKYRKTPNLLAKKERYLFFCYLLCVMYQFFCL